MEVKEYKVTIRDVLCQRQVELFLVSRQTFETSLKPRFEIAFVNASMSVNLEETSAIFKIPLPNESISSAKKRKKGLKELT